MEKRLNIGMIGCAFMGKVHTTAYKRLTDFMDPVPAIPVMHTVCGGTDAEAEAMKKKFGYQFCTSDWHDVTGNPQIDVIDNVSPNFLHAEPCIAALKEGKHTIVEKPMCINMDQAERMLAAALEAQKQGVKHMLCHNYRFVPALMLARKLIQDGKIGELYQFRSIFPGGMVDPTQPLSWRHQTEYAGYGVHGDLNAHAIDICRYLTGMEFSRVMGWSKQFIYKRPLMGQPDKVGDVTTEDVALVWAEMENGAPATFEATNFSTGIGGQWRIEIHGSRGAITFDLSKVNELKYYNGSDPMELQGLRTIDMHMTSDNEFLKYYWPKGHALGWEHNHCNAIFYFIDCIANGKEVADIGADFLEGYKDMVAIQAAYDSMLAGGKWISVPKV